MLRTKTGLAMAGLAGAALLASACGGGGQPAAPPKAQAPVAATANQIGLTPRDGVRDGGTFTWPLSSLPPNFNYNELDGTLEDNARVISALMPAVYATDASGTPIWDPNYLASEPVLVVEPKQVVTYRINPRAAWYDGTPLTWEDFYWQWRAGNGTDKAYRVASASGYEDIENVQKGHDEHEVVVTFKHKYADWTAIFNPIYPASTNRSAVLFNDGWKERPLTTAGPFKLDHIDQTAKTITLVRNEKWWGERAKLDTIVFRVIEPDAQIDALANGEIDAMDIGPDANKFHRAQAITAAEVRIAGGPNFRHLTFNGSSVHLQDLRVRQAIAMAIDRATIARAMLGPLGLDARPLDNHIFMSNQQGYRNQSGAVGAYDPVKAGQLLDEAGWKLEGTVRRKGGMPLEVDAVIPAAVATSKQEVELLQNMLARIGVTLKIQTVPGDDFFDKYITPGQFDLTVFSWMGTPYPISSSKSIYAKPRPNAKGELEVRQNYARVGSDEIDRLYAQATQELDRAKATELANQIDALIWQEVHSLTTYQRPELVACRKTLVNFGAFGFASWVYQDIGFAKP